MRDESLQFLQTLLNTPSPTSHETRGQRVWLDYVNEFADETFTDAYGNAVATLNKGGSPRIMLAAHADEIAMTVNYINSEGFIYVRRMGGIDPAITKAQRVTIHAADGPINGVVGNVPPHLTKGEENKKKAPEMHDLFLDIGATSKSDAEKYVRVGDPITLNSGFELLRNKLATARAFDNRVGTFAVADTLREIKASGSPVQAEICAVSNTMEEIGALGARQIAYNLNPAGAVVIDVTHATDYPTVSKEQHGEIALGKGPTVTHGRGNHPEIVSRLEQIAKENELPLQHEAPSTTSGTDNDVIFWTRGGIPSALVSLPNRYMHSPVEIIHLEDLEKVSQLLTGFALSIKQDDAFKVKI